MPRHPLLLPIIALALTTLPACNIVGPAAYFIGGPEKVKPRYELPETRPTVIFLDDRKSTIPRRSLRLIVAETAQERLLAERVVKDMVSAQSAVQAAGRDGPDGPLPVSEVGRRIAAEVVIHVVVDSFALSPDGATYRPEATIRVRVIDATTEKRLWPKEEAGSTLTTTLRTTARIMPTSTSEAFKAEEELARALGEDLARLFYKHVPEKGIRTPN